VVGLGAAAYSPAKYGILTELLPPSQLVKANGWIEGLTIASIILGVLLGGQLVGPHLSAAAARFDLPMVDTGIDTAPKPPSRADPGLRAGRLVQHPHPAHRRGDAPLPRNWPSSNCCPTSGAATPACGSDKLGQISLATTTLFWGVSGNLRYIVLAWAAAALGYSTTQASSLVGVVAMGTAVGAVVASVRMRWTGHQRDAAGHRHGLAGDPAELHRQRLGGGAFPDLLGGLGGFLVVPMNALLQHRGHNLMGAGRSIAVQNFNEQACILGLGGVLQPVSAQGAADCPRLAAKRAVIEKGISVGLARQSRQRRFDVVGMIHLTPQAAQFADQRAPREADFAHQQDGRRACQCGQARR
jgi:LPLT family lysophospholipid transporter-like MFS transporter